MSRYYSIIIVIAFLCSNSAVQADGVPSDEAPDRYSACLDIAVKEPDEAINQALIWQKDGGGVPARHCEAIGLFYMGEYSEAATRMDRIAADMEAGKDMPLMGDGSFMAATPEMLADMYDQAANAWLMGGELVEAESSIDNALSIIDETSPLELDLRVDRARIAAASDDYGLALSDLEYVSSVSSARTDILVLLASAARGLGDYGKAEKALDTYVAAFPNDPAGYLEQGNLYDVTGRTDAARQSWLKVLQLEETGFDADAARANLERIDLVKPDTEGKDK